MQSKILLVQQRILVVENDLSTLKLYALLLKGFEVAMFSGFESLYPLVGMSITFPADTDKPVRDDILVDPTIYGIGLFDGFVDGNHWGYEIAQRFSLEGLLCVNTSSAGQQMADKMTLAGVKIHLPKPYGYKTIRGVVEQHLGSRS